VRMGALQGLGQTLLLGVGSPAEPLTTGSVEDVLAVTFGLTVLGTAALFGVGRGSCNQQSAAA
jgi:hypothetical protein